MRSSGNNDNVTIRSLHKIELSIQTGVTLHHLLRPTGNRDHIRRDSIVFSNQNFVIARTVLVAKGVANRRGTVTMTGLSGHPIVLNRLRGISSHAIMGENAIVMVGVKTPCVREI